MAIESILNMTDSLNIYSGILTPEFSKLVWIELHQKLGETHAFTIHLLPNTDDVIQRIHYRENDVIKSISANITQSSSVDTEIVAKNKLLKFLDVTMILNFYYNELEGFSYLPKLLLETDSNKIVTVGKREE